MMLVTVFVLATGTFSPGAHVIAKEAAVQGEVRTPDPVTMQELRSELQYIAAPDQSPTLLQRLRAWVIERLMRFFSNRVASSIYTWAWYLFFAILLIFAIILIFRDEVNSVFRVRGRNVGVADQALWQEEKIEGRDFLGMANEMAAAGDFRLALRYRYLHMIQLLSSRGHIAWRPDKTNHDYLRELSGSPLRDSFRYITYLFNYTWYGHFELDEATYRKAANSLEAVQRQMEGS
jgi:hypothetical protein